MPTYAYRCKKCDHEFEIFHGIKDETPRRCPKCRSKAVRVPSGGAGLLFRGTGFYITDYRSQSYKDKAKQEKSAAGSAKSEGGSGKSEGGSSPGAGGDKGTKGKKATG
jgi:putative FmdB family regulatory protein